MIRPSWFTAIAIAVTAFAACSASADPIAPDTWYTFSFGDVGSPLTALGANPLGTNPDDLNPVVAAPNAPWTITTSGLAGLRVVDGQASIDQFEMFDSGSALNPAVLGITSAPTVGSQCGTDITCALNNPAFSRGTFLLATGVHSLSGTHVGGPSGAPGIGYFEVVPSAAPPPTTPPQKPPALRGAAAGLAASDFVIAGGFSLISGLIGKLPIATPFALTTLLDEESAQAAAEGAAAFKLARDPADAPDYTQVVVPTPKTLPLNLTGIPTGLATSLQAFVQDSANGSADANAALTSFNRAMAAFSAGDLTSEQLQLNALNSFGTQFMAAEIAQGQDLIAL
jgi:hypothetical protein